MERKMDKEKPPGDRMTLATLVAGVILGGAFFLVIFAGLLGLAIGESLEVFVPIAIVTLVIALICAYTMLEP